MASAQERPAKRAKLRELEYGETIDILVGPEQFKFTVHKAKICDSSMYIRAKVAAWDESFLLSRISVPWPTIEIFDDYPRWIYSRDVAVVSPVEAEQDEGKVETLHRLVKLHILAWQLRDLELCNRTADIIEKHISKADSSLPRETTVTLIFRDLPPGASLRKLMIDGCSGSKYLMHKNCEPISCKHAEWLLRNWDELPTDFLEAVVQRKFEVSCSAQGRAESVSPRCEYHEHSEEVRSCGPSPASRRDCAKCKYDAEAVESAIKY